MKRVFRLRPNLFDSPPQTRQTLVRTILWPAWVALGVLTLLFSFDISVPTWLQYLPFVASIFLFGLPHGAVDHLVLPRLRGEPVRVKFLLAFIALYAMLVALYLVFWLVAPLIAFIVFIAMTWFHWGQGDLYTVLALGQSGYLAGRSHRLVTLTVRGGFPMLAPFLAFPELYRSEAQNLIAIFQAGAASHIDWAFDPAMRLAAGTAFAVVVLVSVGLGYVNARRANQLTFWYIDVWECILLAAYFSLVPPVLAIGVYFCLWHSIRHIARLMLIEPQAAEALRANRFQEALARFYRDALPLTVAATVILAGFYVVVPRAPENIRDLVGLYLAFIAALTFPHIIIVSWMDWFQGVWVTKSSPISSQAKILVEELQNKDHILNVS